MPETSSTCDYGGKIQVDTGCVVAFDDQITYGVERIGKFNASGLTTAFLGGEKSPSRRSRATAA